MKYKNMRLICMFDLPMETPDELREYRTFRKNLLKEGFVMMQFSVYIRICPSREFGQRLENRIKKIIPNQGNVRLLCITEKQYEDIKMLVGSKNIRENAIGTERMIIL